MPIFVVQVGDINRKKLVEAPTDKILNFFLLKQDTNKNHQAWPALTYWKVDDSNQDVDLMLDDHENVIYEKSFIRNEYNYWAQSYYADYDYKKGLRKITYCGKFDHNGDSFILWNGVRLSPNESLKVSNHSPDGFAWGYNGSGPAQAALAILLQETRDVALSVKHYQKFKSNFVANWPAAKEWTLTSDEIRNWIANQE